jgi:hypothetical protein
LKTILFIPLIFILLSSGCSYDGSPNKAPMKVEIKDTLIKGVSFVKVPGGKFLSGESGQEMQIPYTYYIMKYEATNRLYFLYLQEELTLGHLFITDHKVYKTIKGLHHLPGHTYYIKVLNDAITFDGEKFLLDSTLAINSRYFYKLGIGAMDFSRHYGFESAYQGRMGKSSERLQ